MVKISFDELGNQSYNFSQSNASFQKWNNACGFSFMGNPRQNNGITLFLCDEAIYTLPTGEKLHFGFGDVVLLPKNTEYSVKFVSHSKDTAEVILVRFLLFDDYGNEIMLGDKITRVATKTGTHMHSLFMDVLNTYNRITAPNGNYKIKLYNLFEHIIETMANDSNRLGDVISYINNNLNSDLSIPTLSRVAMMSNSNLRKVFTALFGISPKKYIDTLKINKAKDLLLNADLSVQEISQMLNFYDTAHFSKTFKKIVGKTVTEYRKESN